MTTFRAHYDGKVIVPDEPVDLPQDQPLEIQSRPLPKEERPFKPLTSEEYRKMSVEERLRRLEKFAGSISAPVLPDEALRRENMYEERL